MKPYFTAPGVTLWHANALDLPLPDASVDLIVTSPPYFGLRSYQDGGKHYAGQIGSEATPAEFLDALIAATREMVRVLKPSGSIFVNLGDKYAAGHGGSSTEGNGVNITVRRTRQAATHWAGESAHPSKSTSAIVLRPKSLMGMPWRYAIRCIDELGLILRAEVIWSKPNGLPESVTDRARRSHEQWFHFTVQPRYFAAVDEIREPHSGGAHPARKDKGVSPRNAKIAATGDHGLRRSNTDPSLFDPRGKLPGSVWEVPTQPLTVPAELGVDHFAAFPMEWPRRIIKGWAPTAGVCVECGEGRRPVIDKRFLPLQVPNNVGKWDIAAEDGRDVVAKPYGRAAASATITGYACACAEPTAPTTPAVVLDPFGGTGTTALVASVLGCHGHSVDLSADYCRLAQWRVTDPGQRAAAAQVEAVDPVSDDQPDIFDVLDFGGGAA